MAADIAVTGIGLLTPAGIGIEENWARLLRAEPAAAADPGLAGLPVDFGCRVPGFDPDEQVGKRLAWRLDRYEQLAMAAARQAIADSGLDPRTWDGARVGVVLGTAIGGIGTFEREHTNLRERGPVEVSSMLIPMLGVNMAAGYIAIDHGARGPNFATATACASGATAIGTAMGLLRSGACDVVITGGAESSSTPTIVSSFAKMKALSRNEDPARASRPFDTARDGFVIAEGAGVLVLERAADAVARGARVRARLLGYGASADAFHATSPHPDGVGATLAIGAALADAGVLPDEVDHVNAHATSTPVGDVTEAATLRKVLGARPVVTSTKGVTGHTLGAAGAIEACFTALALQHGVVPPTANLVDIDPGVDVDVVAGAPRTLPMRVAISNSFGFGGQNAVLVLAGA
ncbi:3-oxoacyl-[acyl-carrier-protein] synthase, KASII [Alloactinosynnema sp. L-07]|uniref:beta-ketoacyl-[acyl-carrier-protein] synthase family protein n=1 Tax=Alloactinosynnema sp. L-07 TaxID=1653480 RepID=UPI00065F004C|nr:beta-ketoacyl-[acyl-carrier-protein] synthase family protein [Alloactinosynnema sp. L-07]CRK58246.1 3-oxoacyl-[acyl-carrier-protein] synthase, KASII [Alloactinosynnema sp. L-07]